MSEKSESVNGKRPAPHKNKSFIVQCVGFRCMAYRDTKGQWRDYFNDDAIDGDVKVLSEA